MRPGIRAVSYFDSWEWSDLRSSGDQDVLGLDHLFAVVLLSHGDLVRGGDRAEALKMSDLVGLEQHGNASCESLDGGLFLLHQSSQVQSNVIDCKHKIVSIWPHHQRIQAQACKVLTFDSSLHEIAVNSLVI